MKFTIKTIFLTTLLLLSVSSSYANVFYVSPNGRDKNPGTVSKPWKTIDRVNQQDLNAGDQVLFQGGQTFTGSLSFVSGDSGSLTSPVTISSYGTGNAIISSGDNGGLLGYNVNFINVTKLTFVGSGSVNISNGIDFYTDSSLGKTGITLTSLDVSRYGKAGVVIGSWSTKSGYGKISVKNISTHHNGDNGLSVYAQYPYVNKDVYVGSVATSYNMKSGLVIGGVSYVTVENSQSFENGLSVSPVSGPSGIFAYDSTNVIFQNNTSHHTHTSGTDGDGFDFGQNVSYSTMKYNTSYENDGAGYLLDHGPSSGSNHDNIIQNNKSTNDARRLGYGSVQLWGRVINANIHNNSILISPALSNSIAAITLANWSIPSNCINNLSVMNNLFITSGPVLVNVTSDMLQCTSGISFSNNSYQGSPFMVKWGSTSYNDIATWTATTGQN